MVTTHLLDNIITEEELHEILQEFNSLSKIQETSDFVANCEAYYNVPATLKVIDKLEMTLKPLFGENIKFANTYTRRYYNDSHLKIHIDRRELDVTVSLCLERSTAWPLCISTNEIDETWPGDGVGINKSTDYAKWNTVFTGYDLRPRQGVACQGKRAPHWRDTLHCEPGQFNTYCFLHWTFI